MRSKASWFWYICLLNFVLFLAFPPERGLFLVLSVGSLTMSWAGVEEEHAKKAVESGNR